MKGFKSSKNRRFKLYKNELDKAWFTRDAALTDWKDLAKRTISDKILKVRAYKMAINTKYDKYKRGLASRVYECFDRKKTGLRANLNEVLAQALHKLVIKRRSKKVSR